MKQTRLWLLGLLVALSLIWIALISLRSDLIYGRRAPSTSVSSSAHDPAALGEDTMATEISHVQAIGRGYRDLTPADVRATYLELRETNEVPWILIITGMKGKAGEKARFSFDKGKLYQVTITRTNATGFTIFLRGHGSVGSYSEFLSNGYSGLSLIWYANGEPKSVEHYKDSMLLGMARYYSEAGGVILSTNYTRPTEPTLPAELQHGVQIGRRISAE